jgi:hypothetical protein
MICKDCQKGKIVLHAFSFGNCQECGCEVSTAHIPCDKLCQECSDAKHICKECGRNIDEIPETKPELL